MSPTASAQTVFSGEVTAGTITVESHGLSGAIGTLDIAGPGFHLVGTGVGVILGCVTNPDCRSGAIVNLGAFFADGATGVATVNGETRNPAFFAGGDGRGIELYAGEATIPKGHRKHLILTAPFTLKPTGLPVSVFNDRSEWWVGSAPPWAEGVITGSGFALAFLERVHVKGGKESFFYYDVRRVIYSFNAP